MIPAKNLPLFLNLCYVGFNRGLPDGSPSDLMPLKSKDGTILATFCNRFVQYVLNSMGYGEMNDMMANQMHDFMSDPKNGWIEVSMEVGQNHANNGVVVIASHKDDPHGHVCIVLPGILEQSYSWGAKVPKVVNIGGSVFFGKKLSYAFRANQKPTIFALAGMV